ncbi:helix-turn-helix transcriptional regulator [Pseudaeromonas paramecii]|uniref:Helix-turn-helix transcriptional regulator n=1 Tax=Pseudaeromonas paramecii TaxID=2138166 RepID=A0ABP8Q8H9_9GAMM
MPSSRPRPAQVAKPQRHTQASISEAPETLRFCEAHLAARTDVEEEWHTWGQLAFVHNGLMELAIEGQSFIAPPGFGVWIPPRARHRSYNHQALEFGTINLCADWCTSLPLEPCVLDLSPLVLALIAHCHTRPLKAPTNDEELRLARVLVDQLAACQRRERYLPMSEDRLLAPVLRALEQQPADNRSLKAWSRQVHSTERTLTRRCQRELGMSFSEWRQRLRFLHALSLLEGRMSIKEIALELGYSSSSAFISMFHSLAGTTPERYRKRSSEPVPGEALLTR